MQFVDSAAHKIVISILIVGMLIVMVSTTFALSEQNFGNVRLPNAIGNVVEQYALLAQYSLRATEERGVSHMFASAAGSLLLYEADEDKASAAEAVPILVYHAIVKNPDGHNVTQEQFADHMFALKKAGWKTISLKEFKQFMRGDTSVPARSFVLTFDDGAKDSYYPVDPLLTVLDYEAVIFPISLHSVGPGSFYYLSEGEIDTMLKSKRWEIGSHGHDSHAQLPISASGETGAALANRLWIQEENRLETLAEYEERIGRDLQTAREQLENTFGIPVDTFAFPFGEFGHRNTNPELMEIVQQRAGQVYDYAFYQTWEGEGFLYNYPDSSKRPITMIRRLEPLYDWSVEDLLTRLERGLPKSLPFSASFTPQEGWFSTWSSFMLERNRLVMRTGASQTGAAVVLDGTGHWRDYSFKADVESPNNTGVFLWARFKDNDNNAACNFGNGFVHVEQTVDGIHRVIKGVREENIRIPSGEFSVEVHVKDRTVSCVLNGVTMVESEFLNMSLDSGGIGMKIWDRMPGKSEAIIHRVEVSAL